MSQQEMSLPPVHVQGVCPILREVLPSHRLHRKEQLQLFCGVPQVPCRIPPEWATIWYEVGRPLPCLLMGEGGQTC